MMKILGAMVLIVMVVVAGFMGAKIYENHFPAAVEAVSPVEKEASPVPVQAQPGGETKSPETKPGNSGMREKRGPIDADDFDLTRAAMRTPAREAIQNRPLASASFERGEREEGERLNRIGRIYLETAEKLESIR